jgi:hypothetical protein
MIFEALIAVNMMNIVAWDVKPCILVEIIIIMEEPAVPVFMVEG